MTTDQIKALIVRESQAAQLDPACMLRIAEIESGFNPNAKNPLQKVPGKAQAQGLYQIMDFHNVPNAFEPLVNIRWTMDFTKRNHEFLRKNGVPVNCFTTYLAHQQGAAGAVLLWQNRGKRLSELSEKTRTAILKNVDKPQNFTTVEQFLTFWERKISKNAVSRVVSALPDSLQVFLSHATDYQLTAGMTALAAVGISAAITKFVERKPLLKN